MFCLPAGAKYQLFQDPGHRLYGNLEKISYRAFLLFYYFFDDKKIAFKISFDLHFHVLVIEFFRFESVQFKFEENIHIYQAFMLLMCLEVLREGLFCFPVRDWEGVCRKLLSLFFLNFQLLAKMLNFIFIRVTWKLGYLR